MSFLRPATQIARTQLRSTNARTFTRFSPALKADTTPSTQGHATKKAKDPIHKDKDIQSSAVRGGEQNKDEARANPTKDGEDQPFDAARQGNKGGELKTNSAAGTGAFMDQVGGQGAGGAKEGEKVDAAGESYTDMAKNVLTGNFGKGAKVCLVKRRRNYQWKADMQKSFHTSARSYVEPSSDAGPKSREPKHEVEPQSDQSPHLKHKSPSKPDSGKGNAAAEPHLPSKQAEQKRGYATRPPGGYSKTFNSEAAEKGHVSFSLIHGRVDLTDRMYLPRHFLPS